MSRVLFVQNSLPRYRVPFFERLRVRLAVDGIELALAYGRPRGVEAAKAYQAELGWGDQLRNRSLSVGRRDLVWHPCLSAARKADLVVVEQASRLLTNYALLAAQIRGGTPVAFWGHGANQKTHAASGGAELVKRHVSRLPHWWFPYTELSKRLVVGLGYPADRITVVQNAVDTSDIGAQSGDVARFRAGHGLGNGPIGLFSGSLYREKRIGFLLEAADRIHARRPDFRLILLGDGPDRAAVVRDIAARPYAKYLGGRFGRDRAVPFAAARLMLIPGVVGLAVVDAFAAALPLVTTAIDYHSPEIDYLRPGENGIVVAAASSVDAYADAVLRVLGDDAFYERLVTGCRAAAAVYTLDAMVERFAEGIRRALAAPRLRARPSGSAGAPEAASA
jgi:glycosyltransferase involved in cell wall biosynthesis